MIEIINWPTFSVVYREAADEQLEMHICLHNGLPSHRRIHEGGGLQ